MSQTQLRAIPSVDKILQTLGDSGLPRPVVVACVRREITALRKVESIPDFDAIIAHIGKVLSQLRHSRIQPVINGTGVIIHTNLGRSPLSSSVIEAITAVGSAYNNLEFDLASGERGGRANYLENNLALLCGAEAATVVNNCAAALVLILRHFTSGDKKEIIISRGELVQIGGGFRIPDILETSGAKLREVGTTNKTTLKDYQKAIGRNTALLLKVHRSNFFMGGFVESPSTEELAGLAKKHKLPFAEDLGSGAVVDTEKHFGIQREPTPAEVLKRGVQLVCFSGDKLLGGPQAGVIAGSARLVAKLKKDQFFRALRCDKLILSAMQAVVDDFLAASVVEADATVSAPIHKMLSADMAALTRRAKRICRSFAGIPVKATVGAGESQVGGGTLPQVRIKSVTVDLLPREVSLKDFAVRLRNGSKPVVGFIGGNRFRIDLRTVFPAQDKALAEQIKAVFLKAAINQTGSA